MKNPVTDLDKLFDSKVRLGIMSLLMVNDWVEFSRIKELLELTDGNLASHIVALEKSNYIQVKKEFVGKKPKTWYAATLSGRKAFAKHLDALENLIRQSKLK